MANIRVGGNGRRWFSTAVFVLLFLAAVLLTSHSSAAETSRMRSGFQQAPGSIAQTFTTPEYEIVTDSAGLSTVALEGFYSYGLPGDPALPAALYYIAIPPQVPLDRVTLEISAADQVELQDVYQIPAQGPYAILDEERGGENWGPNAAFIVDGKNTAVYNQDGYFPDAPLELVTVSQMRKWKFAEVRFWPVSYNPVSGSLRLTKRVRLTLRFDTPDATPDSVAERQVALADTLMDGQAAEMLLNFDEAQDWYVNEEAGRMDQAAKRPGYAIIMPDDLADARSYFELDKFVAHKESLGFNVIVVTASGPDGYGALEGPWPNETPEKVRLWLQNHYLVDNIQYVLLIGNPDPRDYLNIRDDAIGDMPMKMTWPSGWSNYRYPTDLYFADLTGNWDKDGDGWYAFYDSYKKFHKLPNDYDPDGVDFWPEVYVGRIPVYKDDYPYPYYWMSDLHRILLKIIAYESSADRDWRRSALLPMVFLDVDNDMAILAEDMKAGYLKAAGFNTHSMYMNVYDENGNKKCVSKFINESDEPLVDGAVRDYWKDNPVGIVTWAAHGAAAIASLGHNECDANDHYLFKSEWAADLDDSKPAIVFQLSCTNGKPDRPGNLGYALLKNGAVATVSGSDATFGFTGNPTPWDALSYSLAYYYMDKVVANSPVGEALFTVKGSPENYLQRSNAMAYNLYGDPSIRLQPDILPRHPEATLSAGSNHTCMIEPGRSANCWGGNYYGQAVDQDGPFNQISAGSYHTCGLQTDGRAVCWGKNDYGQATAPDTPFVQISAGYGHTCGLKANGRVECWGWNSDGQASPPDETFIQISAGNDTCGLKADGRVLCWGGMESQAGPFTQISVGTWHACGLEPDGDVNCWGSNVSGQADDQDGPFAQVSAGDYYTCALRPGGSVVCWGDFGKEQAEDEQVPYAQISAGSGHTCGLSGLGSVICWGDNSQGQARSQIPTLENYLPAMEIAPGNGWKAGIQVQNMGDEIALIDLTAYDAGGQAVNCGQVAEDTGDSANFLSYKDCAPPHPALGSGVLKTDDQPLASIVQMSNSDFQGSGFAGASFKGTSETSTAKTLFFPLVKHNHNGRTTTFSIQNADDAANDITAVFRVKDLEYKKVYRLVPPFASLIITPADAGVPSGFGQVGSLTVSGTQPLAGVSLEHEHAVALAENLQASSAFTPPDFDNILYCPLVRNRHTSSLLTSGVQVQNVTNIEQSIEFFYKPVGGDSQIVQSKRIAPGASATFYAPAVGIPEGSVGAVTLVSSGDIAAVVNEEGVVENGRAIKTTYACFAAKSASYTVLIPLYKEFYTGNTTGIQVQNVSGNGRAATITVEYNVVHKGYYIQNPVKVIFSHHTPVADGKSITFWGVSNLATSSDIFVKEGNTQELYYTYGSAIITADQPIVAIVNESSYGHDASNQDSKNYEGFNK